MKPVVYILKSNLGKYYIGSTYNLERRLAQHAEGHTHSTKRMGYMELVFSQEYKSLKDARNVEFHIKKLKRKDFVEKIVKEGYIRITPR